MGVHSLLESGTTCVHERERYIALLKLIYVQYVARKSPRIHTKVRNKEKHTGPNHMYMLER